MTLNTLSNLSVVGIDVSKETLDVYHLPSKEYLKVKNNKDGFKELLPWLKKHEPDLVLCENTGGYERKVIVALTNASIPVCVANPTHIRYYAKSKGVFCKTDKTDAKIIAGFALERQPLPTRQPNENEMALKEYVALRRQLIKERTALKNQYEHAAQKETRKITKELINLITKRIKKIETTIEKLIQENSEWSKRKKILQSIPGIGVDTVRTLQADMPELGEGSAEKISALAGLAPQNKESGKWKGKAHIYGGRNTVRAAIHNAAMAAIYFTKDDNVFKQMYYHLTENLNKAHNVAVVAVAHKMLKIAHTLVKNGVEWENKLEKKSTSKQ
ncbi:MAG: IS110 family transposase [Planctomycetaceae bacterium]|nr:IS110 family transposase [Planctomycetaceae bacterium]